MQHDHAALLTGVAAVAADLRETAGAWRIEGVDVGTAADVLDDAAAALEGASPVPADATPAYRLLVAILSQPSGPEVRDAIAGIASHVAADPHAARLAASALRTWNAGNEPMDGVADELASRFERLA